MYVAMIYFNMLLDLWFHGAVNDRVCVGLCRVHHMRSTRKQQRRPGLSWHSEAFWFFGHIFGGQPEQYRFHEKSARAARKEYCIFRCGTEDHFINVVKILKHDFGLLINLGP